MRRQALGPVECTVVVWHDEEGWGAVSSPAVDGEVWVHFSDILGQGYRRLLAGGRVTVTYEMFPQDGYAHRAVAVERRS